MPAKEPGRKVSPLALTLTEADFKGVRPKAGRVRAEAAEDPRSELAALLPKVIARKIKDAVPDGFVIDSITFTGEISGKPFGIGVSGQVSVTFARKK